MQIGQTLPHIDLVLGNVSLLVLSLRRARNQMMGQDQMQKHNIEPRQSLVNLYDLNSCLKIEVWGCFPDDTHL